MPKLLKSIFAVVLIFSIAAVQVRSTSAQTKFFDEPAEVLAGTARSFAKIEPIISYVAGRIDRSLYEVGALAERLGSEPAAAFAFVRDHIGFRGYPGSLRGARGVLIDRVGNSLDRSLLLAELLRRNGHEVRISTGLLDEHTAMRLALRNFEAAPTAAPTLLLDGELLATLMTLEGVDEPAIRKALAALNAQDAAEQGAHDESLARDLPIIIGDPEALLRSWSATLETEDLALISKQHFHVQLLIDGIWTDLDPSFPDAEPGRAYSSKSSTFAPDELPWRLEHRLRINIALEFKDPDKPDVQVLDAEFSAGALAGRSLQVTTGPYTSDLERSLASREPATADGQIITASLLLDGTPVGGQFFDLSGEIFDEPPDLADTAASGFGGASGALGNLFEVPGGTDEPAAPDLAALVVTYQLTSPGMDGAELQKTQRRDIFRPGGREELTKGQIAKETFSYTNVLLAGHRTPRAYLAARQTETFFDPGAGMLDALAFVLGAAPEDAAIPELLLTPWAQLAVATQAEFGLQPDGRASTLPQIMQSPNVILRSVEIFDRTDDEIRSVDTIDIVALGARTARARTESERSAMEAQLSSQYAWTLAELQIMHRQSLADGNGIENQIVLGENVQTGEVVHVRVGRGDIEDLNSFQFGRAEEARIAAAIETGKTLVLYMPVSGQELLGWWEMSLVTGELIGRLPDGGGAASEDSSLKVWAWGNVAPADMAFRIGTGILAIPVMMVYSQRCLDEEREHKDPNSQFFGAECAFDAAFYLYVTFALLATTGTVGSFLNLVNLVAIFIRESYRK